MTIGVICEGARSDGPALEVLLKAEFPDLHILIVPTTKKAIFSVVGQLIDDLVDKGCQRVVIAWDLHPVGIQMEVNSQRTHSRPCQKDQRHKLLEVAHATTESFSVDCLELLRRYGFAKGKTSRQSRLYLVCFSESFDAAFLSDTSLLKKLASSKNRSAVALSGVRVPHEVVKPQEVLRRYFGQGYNARLKFFNKATHNVVLAQAFVDNDRLRALRRHNGYSRLVETIASLRDGPLKGGIHALK